MKLRVQLSPFSDAVARNVFDCGRRPITQWLKNNAKKCSERAEYRVTVATVEGSRSVIGYHALQLGSESMAALENKPDNYTKNHTAFPALHLAFLGVDEKYQRQGLGHLLLKDVLKKAYDISQIAGLYALTLQSLDAESTSFYLNLGFTPYTTSSHAPKMLMPIRTVIELVETSELADQKSLAESPHPAHS